MNIKAQTIVWQVETKKKARVTKLDETEWGQRIISQQRATKRVKNQGEAANE